MLTTDQKGGIAEMGIAWHATLLGVDVYKPMSEGGRYDLIFDFDERLWRVQCKWANRYGEVIIVRCYSARRAREGVRQRLYSPDEVDAFAAYCAELDRCFFLPIADVVGQRNIQLRLRPAATCRERFKAGDRKDPSRDRRTRLKAIRLPPNVEEHLAEDVFCLGLIPTKRRSQR